MAGNRAGNVAGNRARSRARNRTWVDGAATAAPQTDVPARRAGPGAGGVRACGGGDTPAGGGGKGIVAAVRDQQRQRPAGFRRQLQPPCRHGRQAVRLAQDGGHGAAAQTFLHDPRQLLLFNAVNYYQVIVVQPVDFQTGCMQDTVGAALRAAP